MILIKKCSSRNEPPTALAVREILKIALPEFTTMENILTMILT